MIDTGLGIPKAQQQNIFKYCNKRQLSKNQEGINKDGTGIGLTLSYSLSLLLQAPTREGIQVVSDEGKGSTFSFYLEDKQQLPESQIGCIEDSQVLDQVEEADEEQIASHHNNSAE